MPHVLHVGQVTDTFPMCYTWERWLKHSPCVTRGKNCSFKSYSIGPMEIGIYITINIVYLVRELYLGDHIGSFSLLERWVVAALFVGRHFPCVLWPLAGDVRRITYSFIALALGIHVFCLRAEAVGAILHTMRKVWGMRSESQFMWEGPRRSCSFASPGSLHYKMCAFLNGYDPRTDLVLGGVRIGMGCMNLVTVISRYTRVPVTLIRDKYLFCCVSIKNTRRCLY